MFAHLNTHSIYSKMRGTIPLMKLITRTKRLHMSHIALTEVNGLWGFIRFVQLAKEQGIKAIAGTNLITEMDNVILLAENQTGYENMCRIISSIHDDPDASIPNLLVLFHSGLFILAHQDSVLVSLATFIPNSHLFVELRPSISEAKAQALANTYQLEIITTGDVYFLSKEDCIGVGPIRFTTLS